MLIPFLLALRTLTLNAQNVERRPAAPEWPVEWIANHCPDFPEGSRSVDVASCRVTASGAFATFQGDRYYYALYCVQQKDADEWGSCDNADSEINRLYSDANVAVFVQRGGVGAVRLVVSQFGFGGHFRRPRIGENSYGAIMELPYVSAATCACNGSSYYLWRAATRTWQEADWESWKKELSRRLPSNLNTWNDGEFWPNLQTLTANSPLWRTDECHACASGGSVSVQLGIVDNRFVLKSLTIHPEEPRR